MLRRLAATRPLLLASTVLALAACATPTAPQVDGLLARVSPTPLLLVGEQHDAPEHQALQRALIERLSQQGRLAAVVMEMVEAGHDTRPLARDATEEQVRAALAWHEAGWPWTTYGPVVMAAVRAGVPVVGGNLPRAAMGGAMRDASLDSSVSPAVLDQQREDIREAHCGLLPATQLTPMARIQLARDRSLAEVARAQLRDGKTVLLIAGNGHVRRDLGVPLHLGAAAGYRVIVARAGEATPGLPADTYWDTPALPPRDHCAELRRQFGR